MVENFWIDVLDIRFNDEHSQGLQLENGDLVKMVIGHEAAVSLTRYPHRYRAALDRFRGQNLESR